MSSGSGGVAKEGLGPWDALSTSGVWPCSFTCPRPDEPAPCPSLGAPSYLRSFFSSPEATVSPLNFGGLCLTYFPNTGCMAHATC